MDGSKRWTILSENIGQPTGLAIDYNNNNRIYFVDTKFGRIESISSKGTDRVTFLQGENLRHPIAIDVFETNVYWINRNTGDLLRQDKFGRGVSVTLDRDLVNPTGVKGTKHLMCN